MCCIKWALWHGHVHTTPTSSAPKKTKKKIRNPTQKGENPSPGGGVSHRLTTRPKVFPHANGCDIKVGWDWDSGFGLILETAAGIFRGYRWAAKCILDVLRLRTARHRVIRTLTTWHRPNRNRNRNRNPKRFPAENGPFMAISWHLSSKLT